MAASEPTLVIGATGTVGRQVVHQLIAMGAAVRALTRDPGHASLPDSVETLQGDLTRPETLDRSLDGVGAVLLVWTAPPAAIDAALTRILARTARIVFLSAPLKTAHPFFQQPNPSRAIMLHIEAVIEASGREWTFLRPGMFAANAGNFWGPQIRAGDLVRWPYLDAPTAPIDERDIAAVAVRVLSGDAHGAMEYVLTGPDSLTQREQIAAIGRMMGRALRIEDIGPDDARRTWWPTAPEAARNMLLDAWAAAIGQPALVTSTVEEITGRPPRPFVDWVSDHAGLFRQ